MSITFPSNTATIIDNIRNAIGRDITFIQTVTTSGCPEAGCSLDPVTGASTNSFCEICDGKYWIPVTTGSVINAHVRWKGLDDEVAYSAGQLFEGDCKVQIDYTDANVTIVNNSETVQVDGKSLSIEKRIYKGVPELNRIVLILNQEDKDV